MITLLEYVGKHAETSLYSDVRIGSSGFNLHSQCEWLSDQNSINLANSGGLLDTHRHETATPGCTCRSLQAERRTDPSAGRRQMVCGTSRKRAYRQRTATCGWGPTEKFCRGRALSPRCARRPTRLQHRHDSRRIVTTWQRPSERIRRRKRLVQRIGVQSWTSNFRRGNRSMCRPWNRRASETRRKTARRWKCRRGYEKSPRLSMRTRLACTHATLSQVGLGRLDHPDRDRVLRRALQGESLEAFRRIPSGRALRRGILE